MTVALAVSEPDARMVTIATGDPLADDVRALIAELDRVLQESEPDQVTENDAGYPYYLSPEALAASDVTLFVARLGVAAVGIGALRRHPGGTAEVKRMYVRPDMQNRGIGGRIVAEIETLARSEGFDRLVLETGDRLKAAWRVYERAGFERCDRLLDYPDSVHSVFYEKTLTTATRQT